MAVNRTRQNVGYGLTNALQGLSPLPIIAQRDPVAADEAELGTIWVNEATGAYFVQASSGTWAAQATGSGIFASVQVTGGAGTVLTVDAGGDTDLGGDLAVAGNTSLNGDLAVVGNVTVTGDFDITDTAAISLTSTANVAPSIYLHANGGVLESIQLHSDQGTGANSVYLLSDVGQIKVEATGNTNNAAVNLIASAGGIQLDAALTSAINVVGAGEDLQLNATGGSIAITATEASATAINIQASDAAGQVIIGGVGGFAISSTNAAASIATGTGALSISADAAATTLNIGTGAAVVKTINVGGTGANVIAIGNTQTAGSVAIGTAMTSGTISIGGTGLQTGTVSIAPGTGAQTVNIATGGTGIKTVNIANGAIDNVVTIGSLTGTASLALQAGTGDLTGDSTGAISLDAAAASNFSVSGAGIDLLLESAAGRVVVNGEEAAADAVRILSAAGGLDANVALQMNLDSSQAAVADAVRIVASAADGGIDVDAGTGGIAIDSTGAVSIQAAAASDFSVSGAGVDLSLVSAAGRVIVNGEEAAANAITLLSAAGGIDANAALEINIDSSEAAATAISLAASNAAGGISVAYGTGGMAIVGTNGAFSVETGTAAINIGADAAAHTITIGNVTGATAVNVNTGTGGFAVATTGAGDIVLNSDDTVLIDADGVLELNSSAGAINIGNDADAQAVNIGTGAAARPVTVGSTNTTSATVIQAGTGGISLNAAGIVEMAAVADTQASPTAASTINANVGAATFTGFTTASGAAEVFTITNSVVSATSQIFVSASNEGANDAQMTVTRVNRGAGSFTVTLTNNGAAALNGNVTIVFWIIG